MTTTDGLQDNGKNPKENKEEKEKNMVISFLV